jgi:Putative transposase
VTLIQRFGSALNVNIHFHMLCLDGAYLVDTRPPLFRRIAPPSQRELQAVAVLMSSSFLTRRRIRSRGRRRPRAVIR